MADQDDTRPLAAHQARYTDAIAAAREQGDDEFQNWFNASSSTSQSLIRGFWDLSLHILTPAVARHISRPEDCTVLEIGYGGGRILHAASHFFKAAIGVDIHGEQETVEQFLTDLGRTNCRLFTTEGTTLPVVDGSIDLVYSFIVLQHLPTYDVLASYMRETSRVLKPGGVAQLYVGTFRKLRLPRRLQHWLRGYAELDAPVNRSSLLVRPGQFKRLLSSVGLRPVASGHSFKQVPDGFGGRRAGQDYVTAVKPG